MKGHLVLERQIIPRLGIGFCRATLGIKHLTARFQPQRFMIAPAAVGDSATCPRRPCLFVRRCRPKESKPASLASPSSRVLPLASAAFLLARNTRSLKFYRGKTTLQLSCAVSG